MFKKPRVYLDYAAATPLSKTVFSAMKPFLLEQFGNPSAVHREGVVAKEALESARTRVAHTLQVRPEFVTFVSGGTESNNTALFGTIDVLQETGRPYHEMEVITTKIEHPSIMRVMEKLERLGVVVRYVAVNEVGQINPAHLGELINEKTVLVSCAFANSEIGTIQPVRALRRTIETAEKKYHSTILFHLDAAQAPLWLSCQFGSLGVDLLSLDVGKCHGPKGVGILVRSRRAQIRSTLCGGGQESGLRPGTENVAGIVGASIALKEAQADWKERAEAVNLIREAGITYLLKTLPEAVLNGPTDVERLANNINISLPGLDTEFATIVLDSKGFAVSTKSACAGAGGGVSVVVETISGDPARARSTLRISLGPTITLKNIKELAHVLHAHSKQMKSLTNP